MATERRSKMWGSALSAVLHDTADPAGLAALRIGFGLLMAFAVARFWAMGWIEELYLAPRFHFTYLGFEWVRPWPGIWLHVHFAVMGACALLVAVGFFTRISAAAFAVLFTYAELIDKAAYLNHYYLVSLLALLLAVTPSGAAFSLDALRRGPTPVPRVAYLLLRGQVGVVYAYAGLAKIGSDWLLRAEPLGTWLRARADLPLVGPLLAEPWVAYAMSWAGAAFDLSVVPLLVFRKTRPIAVALAVAFHAAVGVLFPIGVFPFVMVLAITAFFDPSWPRRIAERLAPGTRLGAAARPLQGPLRRPATLLSAFAALHLAVQVLLPLRFLAYPGHGLWTEEGFRFAWRVMLIEKTGRVEFDVRSSDPPRRYRVFPREELTPLQLRMMSTQPDMIHEYAIHLRDRFERRGLSGIAVHADSWAALNGRPSQRLVDPAADLAKIPRAAVAPSPFIVSFAGGRQ
jgi:hypothetical protein